MSRVLHSVAVMNGVSLAQEDRLVEGHFQAAHGVGGGAGQVVNIDIVATLPAAYTVTATPSQDAVCYVTNRTQAGFRIVVSPRLAANTLAAGTVDYQISA